MASNSSDEIYYQLVHIEEPGHSDVLLVSPENLLCKNSQIFIAHGDFSQKLWTYYAGNAANASTCT